METLVHLWWRVYLAVPLMMLGAAIAVWGSKRCTHGLCRAVRGDSAHLAPGVEGFRLAVLGLALVGLGVAWVWHLTWLLVLSLTTAAGETLETSLILFALRHGARLEISGPRTRAV